MARQLFYPAGTGGDDTTPVDFDARRAGWSYSGLKVLDMQAGESRVVVTGTTEMAVLPLSGGGSVEVEDQVFTLAGRTGVFDAVSDFAYIPIDSEVRITADRPSEIALCTAEATRRIDPYYVPATDIAIEVRGGGVGTRQINNFLSADVRDADKLIAVEVITPEGSRGRRIRLTSTTSSAPTRSSSRRSTTSGSTETTASASSTATRLTMRSTKPC